LAQARSRWVFLCFRYAAPLIRMIWRLVRYALAMAEMVVLNSSQLDKVKIPG
jgi:hypothetical protein